MVPSKLALPTSGLKKGFDHAVVQKENIQAVF
jgi:hypothetical protein